MFDELLKYNIEPDYPLPLRNAAASGAAVRWLDQPQVVDFFVRFAEVVFERHKHKVKYWMTFNEINNQRNWRAPLFGYCCSGVVYTDYENPEETSTALRSPVRCQRAGGESGAADQSTDAGRLHAGHGGALSVLL